MKATTRMAVLLLLGTVARPAGAEDALSHFLKGEALYQERKFSEAIGEFEQALKLDAKLKPAHYYLATIYKQQRKYPDAVEHYAKFVELARSDEPAERQPIREALAEMVNLQYELQQYKEAYEAADKLLKLAGSLAPARVDLMELAAKAGRLGEVTRELEQALERDPTQADNYTRLLRAHEVAGRKADALALLRRAVENCPRDSGLQRSLASAYRERKQFDEAEQAYRAAIAALPDFYGNYEALASMLVECGREKEALEPLDKAMELTRQRLHGDSVFERLGRLRTQARAKVFGPDDVLRDVLAKVNASPKDPAAHRGYASALEQTGRYDKALDEYLTAVALDNEWRELNAFETRMRALKRSDDVARILLAKTLRLEKTDEWESRLARDRFLGDLTAKRLDPTATAVLDAQLREHPDCVGLHVLREQVYQRVENNLPAALEERRKILELAPENQSGYLGLGDLLTAAGKREEALAAYEKCRELGNTTSVPLARMGDLHRELGQPDKALECYEAALKLPVAPNQQSELWLQVIALSEQLGKTEALRARMDEWTGKEPGQATAWRIRGQFLWKQGEREAAQASFDKALEVAGKEVSVARELARFYLAQADEGRAEAALLAGMKANPRSFDLHREAFDFYRDRQLYDRAIDVGKLLLATLDGRDRASWDYQLRLCFTKAGRDRDAVEYFEQRLKADPTDQSARQMRALAMHSSSRPASPAPAPAPALVGPGAAAGVKLAVFDRTLLEADSGAEAAGFTARQHRDFRVRLSAEEPLKGSLSVSGMRFGSTSPPARLSTAGPEGAAASWEAATIETGHGKLGTLFSAQTPTTVGPCPVEGLYVKRRLEPLGGQRYRCEVNVRCPQPVAIRVTESPGTVIESDSAQPAGVATGSGFLLGQVALPPRLLDCTDERTFAFVLHSKTKPLLPQVDLSRQVQTDPIVLSAPGGGFALLVNEVTVRLSHVPRIAQQDLAASEIWHLTVPAGTPTGD